MLTKTSVSSSMSVISSGSGFFSLSMDFKLIFVRFSFKNNAYFYNFFFKINNKNNSSIGVVSFNSFKLTSGKTELTIDVDWPVKRKNYGILCQNYLCSDI